MNQKTVNKKTPTTSLLQDSLGTTLFLTHSELLCMLGLHICVCVCLIWVYQFVTLRSARGGRP